MGQHINEFAPLKRQGFQVCDDARGGGPEQAQICCNFTGSDGFDNASYDQSVGQATGGNQGWIPNVINIVV